MLRLDSAGGEPHTSGEAPIWLGIPVERSRSRPVERPPDEAERPQVVGDGRVGRPVRESGRPAGEGDEEAVAAQ